MYGGVPLGLGNTGCQQVKEENYKDVKSKKRRRK